MERTRFFGTPRRFVAALALATAMSLQSCGDSNGPGGNTQAVIAALLVEPETPGGNTLTALEMTARLTVTATTASGDIVSDFNPPTWSSSNTAAVTVFGGIVTAVANGTATISAALDGVTGTLTVTVAQEAASIVIGPATVPSLPSIGATAVLTVEALDALNHQVANAGVTWTSSAPAVATVASGTVTAVANGTANITATANGVSATKAVTVAQVVDEVVITPGTAATFDAVGATLALSAVARDANDNTMAGAAITWATSSGGVATVNAGTVTSAGNGTTRITAGSAGKLDTVNVTVAQVANNVALTCAATALSTWGATRQCNATVRDRLNVNMAGAITWSSSVPGVATVSGTGLASAKDNGTTNIVATHGALSASQAATVDFKIAYGSLVSGTIETPGPLHEYDITGGGATSQLVAWVHRSPIGSAGIDPHFFVLNNSFALGGVTTGRLNAGAELYARAEYPTNLASELTVYGEASSTGGYVMGVSDCRFPWGSFAVGSFYAWGQLQTTDCAVLNGASAGTAANLTSAVVTRMTQLVAGGNFSVEVVRGCNPGATANLGCTGGGSSTIDPYIYVFGPNQGQVWYDDDGTGTINSRVTINPVPTTGAYTVLITTFQAGQNGVFTLCFFTDCATNPGGPSFQPAPNAPAIVDASSKLTVEAAYARLEKLGLLPKGFDWRNVRTVK